MKSGFCLLPSIERSAANARTNGNVECMSVDVEGG